MEVSLKRLEYRTEATRHSCLERIKSGMLPKGYSKRRATILDYDTIRSISHRVYGDEDMVPSYFHTWITNRNVQIHTMEHEKLCVSVIVFICFFFQEKNLVYRI